MWCLYAVEYGVAVKKDRHEAFERKSGYDVPKAPSPVEKQLTRQVSDSPGKTVCTGESNIPPGTVQSGKGLQSKSQFRTIAPKIAPKVLTSRVLPCHPPSLSDQGHLGPSIGPKPQGMPAQNYALMQVAGPEGTFSLVALPPVTSALKPNMSKNLKLPIPRYQPPRSDKGPRKKLSLSSPQSGHSRPLAHTLTSSQKSPSPAYTELPHKPSPCQQVPLPDQVSAGASTAALTKDSGHGDSRSPDTNSCRNHSPPAMPVLSITEPSAKQSLSGSSEPTNHTCKKTPSESCAIASETLEHVGSVKAVTSLSPTFWGTAVQLMSAAPKGKLPILPCSRVETAESHKIESDSNIAGFSLPGYRADCGKRSSVRDSSDAAHRMTSQTPVPQESKQSLRHNTLDPVIKPDISHKTKLNVGAGKRKGRKRKLPDEIVAFQGQRRKCIINKCRQGEEEAKNDPQESKGQRPGALKKYRSIMPKPVIVMSPLVPLASPAVTVPSQTSSSLGQDGLLNNSLTSKHLSCKQNDSPFPKPVSVFRNGFPGVKKSWHRCHVCNHHFQFKQHLRDHMNTHTNRRPYSCRICRKAYVRAGSLSTHMKLHHSENRLKKLVCCEFCAKVFGHIRVYFGHLREVHRVVISTEPTPGELQPGDVPRSRDREAAVQGMDGSLERENKSGLEEDLLLNQAGDVKLQIKCGRCQVTAQSFAEIKFHLLYVHGEEIQGRLQEGPSAGSRGAQEVPAKRDAPDWRQRPGRRKQVKPWALEDESRASTEVKGHLCLHHQNGVGMLPDKERGQPGTRGPEEEPQTPEGHSPHTVFLWSHSGFSCLLCAQTLGKKEELFLHWERQHSCEDPSRLWAILSTFSNQGVIELSRETGK
ncbi:zinc finger protein 438 [Ctenodactylus gundi]